MDAFPLWLLARDPDLRARWRRWLTADGWSVKELPAGGVPARLPRDRPGPLLVDAALLDEKDAGAVRALSASRIPVIVFGEGAYGSNESAIRWLREGADDFVPASIHERLLLAKLEAHVRRILPRAGPAVLFSPRHRIKADARRRAAWTKDAEGVWAPVPALTDTELKLLVLLLSSPDVPLERAGILERVWGERADAVFSATLTQHIMSVRQKLGREGDSIRTLYGYGYMFQEDP